MASGLLNAGLLLRLLAEPFAVETDPAPASSVLLGISAVLPAVAAVAFAVAIWPRVREVSLTPVRRECAIGRAGVRRQRGHVPATAANTHARRLWFDGSRARPP